MPALARQRPDRAALVPAAINLTVLGAMTAPAVTGLPAAIDALVPASERTGTLALALTLGAVAATVANPTFGALSDRTRTRLGGRHPWIIGGALGGAVAAWMLVASTSTASLLAAWVLMQTSYNASLAAAAGLLADAVPEQERSVASGIFSAAAFLGAVPALVLSAVFPTHVSAVTLTMAAVAVAVAIGAVRWLPAAAARSGEKTDAAARATASVRRFAPVWLSRLLQSIAFGLVTSFMLFLVADRVAGAPAEAAALTSVSTLAGGGALVVAALVAGGTRGRIDPRILLAGSSALLAGAAILRAVAADALTLVLSAVAGGAAMGAFFTVNLAIALRRVPAGAGGRYLGALNMADTLPQIIVPLVAARLLTLGGPDPVSGAADNYATLYLTAAAVSVSGLLVLPFLGLGADRRLEHGIDPGIENPPGGERA